MKPLPHNLRSECVSFISCMLARDPRNRLSAHDLLQHPYIKLHCQAVRTASGGIPAYRKSMSRQGSADPANAVLPTVPELKGTSSTASQTQALPLSFSLRHNELADTTIPEKMVLKVYHFRLIVPNDLCSVQLCRNALHPVPLVPLYCNRCAFSASC